jgi:hypothetical protein
MDLALDDVEVDTVERDDLAVGLADAARANSEPLLARRRPAGPPAGRRRVVKRLGRSPETGQFVSGLGMKPPGTCAGA